LSGSQYKPPALPGVSDLIPMAELEKLCKNIRIMEKDKNVEENEKAKMAKIYLQKLQMN
jgi:hypothetical protein